MSDKLIYAMSTRGYMKLGQFNEIFNRVYLPGNIDAEESIDTIIRLQVIRILDSLGYCEFDFNSRMVYMCPPSLVLLPTCGLPKAVLVGARTPGLVSRLKAAVKKRKEKAILVFSMQGKKNINIPALICIETVDTETMHEIADETGISYDTGKPAAWGLVNFSSSLDEIKQSLRFEERTELNWKRRVFVKHKLKFSKSPQKGESSQMLVEYKNPVDQQLRHWLWNGSRAAEVDRDWGRYIVLSNANLNILLYDQKLHWLAVPVTVPLPCIIARATALCTGTAPILAKTGSKKVAAIPPGHPVHIYSGVPPFIANLILEKLGQKFIHTFLKLDKNGTLYD